ncbi:MAG TPA: type II toxin-antitoxin system VapC family toxin [Thermoanaerobaculia bacterium]|jgi:predicted nucleic acid-binding protein
MRAFLDTNVFLYAAGGSHPERDACARVLRKVADGSLDATVNTEVVQEILYVLVRRGRRKEAVTLARHVTDLFPDLLPVTREDMLSACGLVQRYPRLPARDAVHAATMLRHGLKHVISVDTDFDQVRELRRIEPSAA